MGVLVPFKEIELERATNNFSQRTRQKFHYWCIAEGTLQNHIDHHKEMPWFSWDSCLRIAIEAAGALSYLHSAASVPVIHRDVKSANILLDDCYTAKISDFGASRLVPFDQTKINTLVQGTLGYLDPEYFLTGDLTEKNDVYSFGVVLAELLTGKKPLRPIGDEGSLAKLMIKSIQENSLFKILDQRVMNEGSFEQLQEVGNLIVQCLHVKGEDRPTMREVVTELERIRKSAKSQCVHQNNQVTDVEPMKKEPDMYATLLNELHDNI
ncbi:transmembrane signal receptor [Lithospermum erythrorhizon]|uniref:Transmembrane signal receptor n=1 Tax=Lithospermum erythrorhizon TaxID=34254 RepID=A0AAV3PUQ6_LITER